MEAQKRRQRWTYAEFARLPSEGATRHEIIDGRLVVTPAPALRHQRIVTKLVSALHAFVQENDLGEVFAGPVDVLFAEGDYLEPDVVFVRKNCAARLTDRGIEGPPNLIVEVTSPSTASRDRGVKLDRYRLYGVGEYWVVDPEQRSIEVWDLAGDATEPVVYGPSMSLEWGPRTAGASIQIDLAQLFASPSS